MKIAAVTATFPPYWGGTGNVAFHNARLMHERGHEVTVFTAAHNSEPSVDAAHGFRVERLPVSFRVGNAPLTPSLLQHLRAFDLIHLHLQYIFGAELAVRAAKRYRIPLAVSYHNQLQDQMPLKRLLFAAYSATAERMAIRAADTIIGVRRSHLLSVYPHLENDSRMVEVQNGIDTRVFHPLDVVDARMRLRLPTHVPVALFVGALDQAHRFKNVDGLIDAFSHVEDRSSLLLVVGEGDLRPGLEARARAHGLAGRVRFLGSRPPEDLPVIYSAADVTVLPSLSTESFGLVLVESLACATPVIASDLPGLRDLVRQGGNGWLVPQGNHRRLAELLSMVLANRAAAARLGTTARAEAATVYDWSAIGERLERVLAGTHAAGRGSR